MALVTPNSLLARLCQGLMIATSAVIPVFQHQPIVLQILTLTIFGLSTAVFALLNHAVILRCVSWLLTMLLAICIIRPISDIALSFENRRVPMFFAFFISATVELAKWEPPAFFVRNRDPSAEKASRLQEHFLSSVTGAVPSNPASVTSRSSDISLPKIGVFKADWDFLTRQFFPSRTSSLGEDASGLESEDEVGR